jgi:hypothetical protein
MNRDRDNVLFGVPEPGNAFGVAERSPQTVDGIDRSREPTYWRILGRSSRTVATFTSPAQLADWQRRTIAAIENDSMPAERFTVVALDELGVELWRQELWGPKA